MGDWHLKREFSGVNVKNPSTDLALVNTREIYARVIGNKAVLPQFSGNENEHLSLGKRALAELLVSQRKVSLESQSGVFIVQPFSGPPQAVVLEKERCVCKMKSCIHIQAAKISARVPSTENRKVLSLTELMRSKRGKELSGGKKSD